MSDEMEVPAFGPEFKLLCHNGHEVKNSITFTLGPGCKSATTTIDAPDCVTECFTGGGTVTMRAVEPQIDTKMVDAFDRVGMEIMLNESVTVMTEATDQLHKIRELVNKGMAIANDSRGYGVIEIGNVMMIVRQLDALLNDKEVSGE